MELKLKNLITQSRNSNVSFSVSEAKQVALLQRHPKSFLGCQVEHGVLMQRGVGYVFLCWVHG